ncbi:MAG: LptF/LptG family permease [Alphaproteobacteria bacterium]|nr:LptF/LptG family permease [Alphaproteobacteria bacterium]MBV9371357.1 LptF/LptG family permease [Alphaproteobacteria bacterium]MBV9901821.1 LptF/LptG family permease [Alphaproteobacteria bacterium]
MLTRTDRYIARLVFVPLVATLTLAAMLLILEKMLKLFNIVIGYGGPVGVVWKMLANLIPEYLGLGIPIGLLLGTLLAFRRLALSSELDTLRGVGLSYTRLLRVPFLYAILLLGLNLAIVGYLQPRSRYNYEHLRFDLRSGALGASIKVGEFTNLGKRMTLRVERSERQGRLLHGVFVRAETRDGKTVIATADHGTFLATDDPGTLLLRLANGRLVHNAPTYKAPRVLAFKIQDLPVNLPAIEAFRSRGGSFKSEELTLPELLKLGEARRVDRQTQAAARANFHFRLVEIVMMLLMPVLAVALAVPPKRSTSGLGIFLSIVMVVTYHKVNQYAERMGELGRIDPVIALWTPFILFAALIVWMYWTLAYKPGGQPIGALERAFSKVAKALRRLLRLGQRRQVATAAP